MRSKFTLLRCRYNKAPTFVEALSFEKWCPGPDLNRHSYSPADFESAASTNFATRADAAHYTYINLIDNHFFQPYRNQLPQTYGMQPMRLEHHQPLFFHSPLPTWFIRLLLGIIKNHASEVACTFILWRKRNSGIKCFVIVYSVWLIWHMSSSTAVWAIWLIGK